MTSLKLGGAPNRPRAQRRLETVVLVLAFLTLSVSAGLGWLAVLDDATLKSAPVVDSHAEFLVRDWAAEAEATAVGAVVLNQKADADLVRLLVPQMNASSRRISALQTKLASSFQDPAAQALLAKASAKGKVYEDVQLALTEEREAVPGYDSAHGIGPPLAPAIADYLEALHDLLDYTKKHAAQSAPAIAAAAASGRKVLLVAFGISVLLAIAVTSLFGISLSRNRRPRDVREGTSFDPHSQRGQV